MSYDVYWVKNRAEKIADFEHPTFSGLSEKFSDISWLFLERYSPAEPIAMFHSEWPHWSCWIQNMPLFKVGSVINGKKYIK